MNQNTQSVASLSFAEILALPAADKEKFGLVHTPGEIDQQPETWRQTFEIVRRQQQKIIDFLRECGLDGTENGRVCVWLIGAGTSDYVGRALAPLMRKEWRCHVRAVPSTDLLTEMDSEVGSAPADARHLWISFSRSGDSFEGVKILEKAIEKYPSIKHLIVTCSQEGKMANSIARQNAGILCLTLDKRTGDLGLAMTSSFTNMIVAGQCLAHIFELDSYRPTIDALADAAEKAMPAIATAARQIAAIDVTRICFLGSGALKAVADESALKVLEMSAGHYSVMSESFLGLRHGPLSWLGQDAMVVGFLSNSPERRQVELGLLREVRDKKAARSIIAVSPGDIEAVSKSAEHEIVLNIPDRLDDNHRPPLDVLFGQLLGLFASLRQGLKPDTPSADGKITRVVEQIRLD